MKLGILITGKNMEDSAIINRLLWWIDGWCELIDGLSVILSLGFIHPCLATRFSRYRLTKRVEKDKGDIKL